MNNVQQMFTRLLMGGDLRKLRNVKRVLDAVQDQETFDALFSLVFHHERPLVMRAADAVEKITEKHPAYLQPHKSQLISVLKSADHKELKWHVAQLISRLSLSGNEMNDVWHIFTYWAKNKNESKIVRVNALQGLFDLSRRDSLLKPDFEQTLSVIEHERAPSIEARIRKIKKIKK